MSWLCVCRRVSEEKVIELVLGHDVRTVAELGMVSGAGTCCGACKEQVQETLEKALGYLS